MILRKIKTPRITMQIVPILLIPLYLLSHRKTKVGIQGMIKLTRIQIFINES